MRIAFLTVLVLHLYVVNPEFDICVNFFITHINEDIHTVNFYCASSGESLLYILFFFFFFFFFC